VQWAGLSDRSRCVRSMRRLVAAPGSAVPFLKERLPDESGLKVRIKELIDDLDNESFNVREKATRELEQLGNKAVPMLRRALAGKPSPEVRRRVERLLDATKADPRRRREPSPEELSLIRTVIVLARIGTPEARKVLESLAGNGTLQSALDQAYPHDRQALEAKSALDNLSRPKP